MKGVRFNETSMLYAYANDTQYARSKSYSTSERERFTRDVSNESKRLLSMLDQDYNTSSHLSIDARLEVCGIDHDEVVGLERHVLEYPMTTARRRRTHTRVIVAFSTEQQRRSGQCDETELARMSKIFTNIPVEEARQRAERAA